jgi:hypothetical protein
LTSKPGTTGRFDGDARTICSPRLDRGGVVELLERVRAIFDVTYEIEEELPGGGMSRLFIATDRELQRRVVIKILPPELTSEMMTSRFKRESEVTARLQHPHILPVISAGVRDGLLYYVTPFIEGESLRHRLEREGQLPLRDAMRLLREVADALSFAHKLGVVHRDIKPENILIQDGHAVLADFGIAAALSGPDGETLAERLTRTGMSVGTVGYMSPEQSLGERHLDGRADIYALGVVGHEMIAGAPPFSGTTAQAVMMAHIADTPERLDDIRDDVPPMVVSAICRALQKDPADRYQTAGELRDALEDPTATSVNFTRAFRLRRLRRHRRAMAIGIPVFLASTAAVMVGIREWRARRAPEPYILVAVAPFNALGPGLELWREGMVDLMTRNLDGAGPLRTVSPTLAIRDFPTVTNLAAAKALAIRMRAQYALFGNVTGSGAEDSVRVRGSLVNMATNEVWEFERRAASVDAGADSLTLAVLEQLGRTHRIGAVRRVSLGSASVSAMRAFLQGEQFYRRTSWDTAGALYQRAITIDTGFALALRRQAEVSGWFNGGDSLARALHLRAGRHNHGLAPRDSLLVSADSLRAALFTMAIDSLDWTKVRRLFAIVNDAAARYPDDPEVWYAVGEARFHLGYGKLAHTTERDVLDAFDRSISLDSSIAPAYVHAIELAFTLDGEAKGRRYARSYLSHDPTGPDADGIALLERMLSRQAGDAARLDAMADSVSAKALFYAWLPIRRWPDSAETALRLLRSLERRPARADPGTVDSAQMRRNLSLELAYRGRMREAYLSQGNVPSRLVADLSLFGTIPADSAAAIFGRWQRAHLPQAYNFMPWLATRGDTGALRALTTSAQAGRTTGTRGQQRAAGYNALAAAAYLALARRDSSEALVRFLALPDTLCLGCYMDRYSTARLLAAAGRLPEAEALLSERLYWTLTPAEIWILAEHGRVAARRGNARAAAESYSRVIRAWERGDPEVQHVVSGARQGLIALRTH